MTPKPPSPTKTTDALFYEAMRRLEVVYEVEPEDQRGQYEDGMECLRKAIESLAPSPKPSAAGTPDPFHIRCNVCGNYAAICKHGLDEAKFAEAVKSSDWPAPSGETRGTRIYAASRASLPERPRMWQKLRAEGFNIISSWIDEAEPGATANLGELWMRIAGEIAGCDVLVLYVEAPDFPLKGALIEVGIALGMNKPIRLVAPGQFFDAPSYRPIGSWINHPLVTKFQTVSEALNWKPVAPEATSYSHDIGGCCGYVVDWHGNDPVLCFLKPGHEEKQHMGQLILRKVAPEAVGTKEKDTFSQNIVHGNPRVGEWNVADPVAQEAPGEAVGRETRELTNDQQLTLSEADGPLYYIFEADCSFSVADPQPIHPLYVSTLRRELALFKAKDQCLPPGFCIGDDLSAEFAIKIVELEETAETLRRERDQLKARVGTWHDCKAQSDAVDRAQAETRKLESQVRELTTERERLNALVLEKIEYIRQQLELRAELRAELRTTIERLDGERALLENREGGNESE